MRLDDKLRGGQFAAMRDGERRQGFFDFAKSKYHVEPTV
jgi:hypothetical protein